MNFKPENTLTQKPTSSYEEGNEQHEQHEEFPQAVEQFLDTGSAVHDTIATLGDIPKEKVPPALLKKIGATFNSLKPYALAAFLAFQSVDAIAQQPGNPFTNDARSGNRTEQNDWERQQQKRQNRNKVFQIGGILTQGNPAAQQTLRVIENAVLTGDQIKQQREQERQRAEWERQQREQQQQWQNQR
jgi:hypothetical protein